MHYIKQATIADVETIQQLAEAIWWPAYSPILEDEQIAYMLSLIYAADTLTRQIGQNEQTYLLLMHNEQPVGFAAFAPRDENPAVFKLHKLYCLPAMQGKGYGKALINEVCQRAINAGSQVLELNVNRYNQAKGMYERMGFEVAHEEDIPIGPYFMNDYVMRKQL